MSQQPGQSPPQQGESKETSQLNVYNPLASPPNLTKALKHMRARRVGKIDMADAKDANMEHCECCGLPAKNHPMPVCGSRLDLADLGAGFPLYFEYVFFCGVLMALLFAIVGVYNLVVNSDGKLCDALANFPEYPCKGGMIFDLSLANRDDEEKFKVASILNLVFVLVGLLVAYYYRRVQSMTAEEVDRGSITTSDYTVIVSDIPSTESAESIKKFFEEKGRRGKGTVKVKKVNMAYDIGAFVALVRRKNKLMEREAKGTITTKQKEELKQVGEQLKVFEDSVDNNSSGKFTGVAFVTLNTESDTMAVLDKFKMSIFEKQLYSFFKSFLSCLGITLDRTYNGKLISLNRAPDPLDVFWENLGYDWWKAIKIRMISFCSTFLLIGASFGAILGIQYWQESVKKSSGTNTSLVTFLAFLASYIVTIINSLIGLFMRKLAGLEKHTTYTYYFISIAAKLTYAQFINTALITLFVQMVQQENIYLWAADGLVSKVFFLSLLNSFVPSLSYIFNPMYLLRLWKQSRMISQGKKSKMTQQEANLLFEGPQIDIAQRYANVQKTMLFAGFYATMLPIGIVFAFVGLFLTYWTDKYMLLRRHARPNALGKELAEEMSDFLELFFVAFASGNLAFSRIHVDKIYALDIVAVCIACVFYALPQKYLSRCIRKRDHGVFNTREYDEVRQHFPTEYDRANPVTQEDAMKDWIMEMSKISGNQDKEEVRQDLKSYFQKPKQNQFTNLANYAQYNPSFKQVHQMTSNTNYNYTFAAPRMMPQQPMYAPQPGQPRPMQIIPQPLSGAFAQPARVMNQQINTFVNGMQQMIPMNRYGMNFGFQPQPQPQPQPVIHQQNMSMQPQMATAQMSQPRPMVASHVPQQNPNVPQPQPASHFPQPQPQPQAYPQQQPPMQPQMQQQRPIQPQVMQVNPPMMQAHPQPQPQFAPQPQPFAGQPPAQYGYQQPQPQQQYGMRPPQVMQQPMMNQQPMMQMGGQPNYGMQPTYAPQMQQGNTGSIFGGQPGFGQWKGTR